MNATSHPQRTLNARSTAFTLIGGFILLLILLIVNSPEPEMTDEDIEARIEANRLNLEKPLDKIRNAARRN